MSWEVPGVNSELTVSSGFSDLFRPDVLLQQEVLQSAWLHIALLVVSSLHAARALSSSSKAEDDMMDFEQHRAVNFNDDKEAEEEEEEEKEDDDFDNVNIGIGMGGGVVSSASVLPWRQNSLPSSSSQSTLPPLYAMDSPADDASGVPAGIPIPRQPSGQGLTLALNPASGHRSPSSPSTSIPRSPSFATVQDLALFKGGKVGLRNLGNTCFMNAALQCLASCGPLAEYFIAEKHLADLNRDNLGAKGEMALAYGGLVKSMWDPASSSAIRPAKLKKVVGKVNPIFAGFHQHDAQEFLRFLLDAVHDDTNRVRAKVPYEEIKDVPGEAEADTARRWWGNYEARNDSHVKDVFAGQLYSHVECKTCGNVSRACDPAWDLSLPLPGKRALAGPAAAGGPGPGTRLEDCLASFTAKETLDGDNRIHCSRCKAQQPSTRTMQVYRAPETLVIHLKRFKQQPDTPGRGSKMQDPVELPIDGLLDLTPFCHKEEASTRPEYRLIGTVNHSGSLQGGHYTANCRHVASGAWFNYNDERVSKMDMRNFDSSSAYLLFFQRVHRDSHKKCNL